MKKTFVGFGFGPIQSALFLFEAHRTGEFDRFVVAEVDAALVAAVSDNGGAYSVNVARESRIDSVTVSGVELCDPAVPSGRARIIEAVSRADEIATALPSVQYFDRGEATSVARMLAEGLAGRAAGRAGILYAAENNNHAAEILDAAVGRYARVPEAFQLLNTVVGKMSGVLTERAEIENLRLATLTPTTPRAVLVEEFNRILVTRVRVPYERSVRAFAEKSDLLPFEEAKLYGHNAVHALIGYLANLEGLKTISEAGANPQIMEAARAAFLEESGAALCRRHAGLGEPLFTPSGYREYAEDLLQRMVNPCLYDLVARVIRDPERKLGYDDRLYGTMRLALRYGIEPARLAMGAAAGVRHLVGTTGLRIRSRSDLERTLMELWGTKADAMAGRLIDLTWSAWGSL